LARLAKPRAQWRSRRNRERALQDWFVWRNVKIDNVARHIDSSGPRQGRGGTGAAHLMSTRSRRGAAAPVSRGAFLKTGAAPSGRRGLGANEPPCNYSRPQTRHQGSTHGRRYSANGRLMVLLVPFGPGAAHIMPFGAIVIEQGLGQRLPRREDPGWHRLGGLSHFARLCHLASPPIT